MIRNKRKRRVSIRVRESKVSCRVTLSIERFIRVPQRPRGVFSVEPWMTIKLRVLESRLRGFVTDDTKECLDMHAKHVELEFEMFERGALRCNLDIENMFVNRVCAKNTSRVVRFSQQKDKSSVIHVEMTRARS